MHKFSAAGSALSLGFGSTGKVGRPLSWKLSRLDLSSTSRHRRLQTEALKPYPLTRIP